MRHTLALLALCAPSFAQDSQHETEYTITACSGCGNMHYESRARSYTTTAGWSSWSAWDDFGYPGSCGPFGENDAEQVYLRASESFCDFTSGCADLRVSVRICGATQSNNCTGSSSCDTKTTQNGFSVWMYWDPRGGDHETQSEAAGTECMQDNDITVTVYSSSTGSTPCDTLDYTDMSTYYTTWAQVAAGCQDAWSQSCGSSFDGSGGTPFVKVVLKYKKLSTCTYFNDAVEVQVTGDSDYCSGPTSPIDPIPDEEYSPALFVIVGSTIQGRTYRIAS